jgi:hypothetical protein
MTSAVLIYHVFYGLPALVVFPAYLVFLLAMSFLGLHNRQREGSEIIRLVCLILGLIIVAWMSYALTPFQVPDRLPDANYIDQLVRIYGEQERVVSGVGTNEAYDYSFYPFFEAFVLLFSKISAIPHELVLRFFSILSVTFFFIVWLSIYRRLLGHADALVASVIALTSFHFSTFYKAVAPNLRPHVCLFIVPCMGSRISLQAYI